MKFLHIAIFAALCSLVSSASAQTNFLKNPGFETWTNNVPASWSTDSVSVTKSTTVKSGSFALKLNEYLLLGVVPFTGIMAQTVHVTGTTFSLHGWYQLKSDTGDGVYFSVLASSVNQLVGAGASEFYQTRSVYTAFATSIFVSGTAIDSCHLTIMMMPDTSKASSDYHIGSYALIDDLVLDNTVTEVTREAFTLPSDYQLSQNYPNPFNPATEIEFTIPAEHHVTLKVYNMMGQEIETLVDEELPQGRYKRAFNASQLSSGVYFYRIEAGNFSQVKKMALLK
jgi:hypothetical protein